MPNRAANSCDRCADRDATATTRWSVFACRVPTQSAAMRPGARTPQRSTGPPRSGTLVGSGSEVMPTNLLPTEDPHLPRAQGCAQVVRGVVGEHELGAGPVGQV